MSLTNRPSRVSHRPSSILLPGNIIAKSWRNPDRQKVYVIACSMESNQRVTSYVAPLRLTTECHDRMGNEGRSGGPQGSKSTRSSEEPIYASASR